VFLKRTVLQWPPAMPTRLDPATPTPPTWCMTWLAVRETRALVGRGPAPTPVRRLIGSKATRPGPSRPHGPPLWPPGWGRISMGSSRPGGPRTSTGPGTGTLSTTSCGPLPPGRRPRALVALLCAPPCLGHYATGSPLSVGRRNCLLPRRTTGPACGRASRRTAWPPVSLGTKSGRTSGENPWRGATARGAPYTAVAVRPPS